MSDITYEISEEKYSLGEQSRTSYGIVAYAGVTDNGTATIVAAIGDVTDDRNKLSGFVEKCNRNGLSLLHLGDAVEDFLAD